MIDVQLFQCENETQVLPTEGWFPPFGIAYIATHAKSKGHNVKLYSAINGTTTKEMIDFAGNVPFVGITTTATTYHSALKIARAAKNKNSETQVILGGPQASALSREILLIRGVNSRDYCVDAVCYGDGVLSFVDGILADKPLRQIPNLVFIDGDMPVKTQRVREDISKWKSIDYSFFDMDKVTSTYGRKFEGITPFKRGLGVMSGLGCAAEHQCGFCARADRKLRFRLPEQFWEEVAFAASNYKVEYFFDLADSILDCPEHLEQLVKTKPTSISPRFRFFARADQLTDSRNLSLLEQMGVYEVFVGFESGSREMLKAMYKGTTPEQNLAAAKALGEREIYIAGCFVLGAPGETKDTLEESVGHVEEIQRVSRNHLLVCGASPVNVLPGSPWFARIKHENGISENDDIDRNLLRQKWYAKFCPAMNFDLIEDYAEKIRKASGARLQYEKGTEKGIGE